ncbi:flagellar protein FlaG [Cohnella abietis]|uniref:Flagellar protein FlaG n=1 Tax=Cohnella abietis TaxID=2507935 RepID=A0A3T1DDB1_9BACL|nr:flagellar protein FlaG [Cohnella abietis]BBI36141.1 hypothetical protein KCTCHS21_55400 [Cohnella abietis]
MDVKAISTNVKNFDPATNQQQSGINQGTTSKSRSTNPSAIELLHKDKFELSVSDLAIRNAIERANKALEGSERRFEFSVHEKTGEIVVKVINETNNEVLREFPNEKIIDMMAKLQELAGLNIDEKR